MVIKFPFFNSISGLSDFPISLGPIPHNLTHPGEFWSPSAGFGIHHTLLPSASQHLLHPNLIPNYKIPNIHAIMQYMGLNSLFNSDRANIAANFSSNSPQNLSVNISATTRSSSPQCSPIDSPIKDSSIEQ